MHLVRPRAPLISNGRWTRHANHADEGVGMVSLITIVEVVSRLKAERYPSLETTNPALPDYQ
jgi:hypothetical protein